MISETAGREISRDFICNVTSSAWDFWPNLDKTGGWKEAVMVPRWDRNMER